MIDGIHKKGLFKNCIENLPDEIYELAYRYAMTGGRVPEEIIEKEISSGCSFSGFINDTFWWEHTVEGEDFWSSIYFNDFNERVYEDDLKRISSYIDFKHFE
jgi:hypothetical protein